MIQRPFSAQIDCKFFYMAMIGGVAANKPDFSEEIRLAEYGVFYVHPPKNRPFRSPQDRLKQDNPATDHTPSRATPPWAFSAVFTVGQA